MINTLLYDHTAQEYPLHAHGLFLWAASRHPVYILRPLPPIYVCPARDRAAVGIFRHYPYRGKLTCAMRGIIVVVTSRETTNVQRIPDLHIFFG